MKKLIALIAVACSTHAVHAQFRAGLEAGMQVSTVTVKVTTPLGSGKGTGDMRIGFRAGVALDAQLERHLFAQSGLFYTQRGFKDADGTDVIRVDYLELPLNLVAKGDLGRGKLFLGAGPYVGFGLTGKINTGTQKRNLVFGDGLDADLKRVDAGINVSGGYEAGSGIYIRGTVNSALSNAQPGGNSNNYVRNWGYAFSLGYLF